MSPDVVMNAFDRNVRLTTRDYVAGEVREAIVRGELVPGQKLNPIEIAKRYGVSQTPAREALQLLGGEDLVRIDAFRGSRVSELTADEYEELYLMRIGLEGLAASLGAIRMSDAGLVEMRLMLESMAEAAAADDVDRFYEKDHRFHLVHYSATDRESLVRRIMGLRKASERYARVAYALPRVSMKDTLTNHRELLSAVADRDGERCERVIREDLVRTLTVFREHYDSEWVMGGVATDE